MQPIGYIDEVNLFSISGWAANLDDVTTAVTVVIMIDGVEIGRMKAEALREGLRKIAPGATGLYVFKYYFASPLSAFKSYDLSVRVHGSKFELSPGKFRMEGVSHAPSRTPLLPLRPLMMTTMGRSGSTLLMSILAAHPGIVVADERPYEVELLTYYAYALRTLMVAGDHEKSLRPDKITSADNQYSIGFNPYFNSSHRLKFKTPALLDQFMHGPLPQILSGAIKDIVVEFYNAVAIDRKKDRPIYFAEKALPEQVIRKSTQHVFGNFKEIVLVRDLRDAVCSFVQYGNLDFDHAFQAMASSAERILNLANSDEPDICYIRYEDLVENPRPTIDKILGYLGLTTDFEIPDSTALFAVHATSNNPRASIGRWRKTLSPEALKRCEQFEEFHLRFNYEPIRASALLEPVSLDDADEQVEAIVVDDRPSAAESEIPVKELMTSFESIGENCEFGLVQRRCGAEPLGLLRFSSAPLPKLLAALKAGFAGMGLSENVEVQVSGNGREYMILDKAFGLLYHAWVQVGEDTAEKVREREVRRLPFLIRKLTEDFSSAEKIFVFHGIAPLNLEQAEELADAVQSYGPSKLLWVELADAHNPAGTAKEVAPGLLKGFMDRFAPGENAHDLSLDCWVKVCKASLILSKASTDMAPPVQMMAF